MWLWLLHSWANWKKGVIDRKWSVCIATNVMHNPKWELRNIGLQFQYRDFVSKWRQVGEWVNNNLFLQVASGWLVILITQLRRVDGSITEECVGNATNCYKLL